MNPQEYFHNLFRVSGLDNSMGQYNYLVFDFIDSQGLCEEFKQYLNKYIDEHLASYEEED